MIGALIFRLQYRFGVGGGGGDNGCGYGLRRETENQTPLSLDVVITPFTTAVLDIQRPRVNGWTSVFLMKLPSVHSCPRTIIKYYIYKKIIDTFITTFSSPPLDASACFVDTSAFT